ncbi:MAG: bifunctional 4-hydroxy-2-oxoglutarate aldolase/2-dehydro-3-deoxy-phosphogluconate aldolase, partial [Oscillospiraceae bacterium]
VKFFPAETAGGIKMIKALAGPFPQLKFMPTGGISESNINDYLSFNKIIACGGSFMVTDELVKTGNYEEITAICKRAMKTVLGIKLGHIGINAENESNCDAISNEISKLTLTETKKGNSSIFVGNEFEVMKTPYYGKNGHVAVTVNDVKRAMSFFKSQGYTFIEDSAKYKDDKLIAIYFEKEIGGFAYHLVQKK